MKISNRIPTMKSATEKANELVENKENHTHEWEYSKYNNSTNKYLERHCKCGLTEIDQLPAHQKNFWIDIKLTELNKMI